MEINTYMKFNASQDSRCRLSVCLFARLVTNRAQLQLRPPLSFATPTSLLVAASSRGAKYGGGLPQLQLSQQSKMLPNDIKNLRKTTKEKRHGMNGMLLLQMID